MNNESAGQEQVQTQDLQLETLSATEKSKVAAIANQIDVTDSQGIIQYGIGTQTQISSFSDSILEQIRTKETGYVGNILVDMMGNVKSLKVDKLSTSKGFLESIPLLGGLVDKFKKFQISYEKVSVNIDKLIDELEKARMMLLKDITLFDSLYDKNLEYLKELDYYILAGKMKIKEIEEKVLPELQAKAEKSGDAVDSQKVQDMNQMLNRLDKKVYDLQLSRMVSIQMNPQIRLVQNNNQVLVEKIQSSIVNTIPLWKNQIVVAIGIFRQKKALELQKEVTDTTNELLQKNSEMLKQGTIDIAKESERGIVEIETLKKVNSDLITTIEETLNIQQEGKQKRHAAEVELGKMEKELKQRLVKLKSEQPQSLK